MKDSEFQNQDVQPEKAPENPTIDGLRMTPVKTALIFASASVLWISLTDLLAVSFFEEDIFLVGLLKGFLFVGAATVLVYWLARRAFLEVEHKWAEKQLQQSQNLLRKTLASIGDAVFLVDPAERTILQCNPASERLFGYTAEEMIGRNTRFLYAQHEDYETFGRESAKILEEKECFCGEFQMQTKDGTLIQTEHNITAVDRQIGWRAGVISIVHDITEINKAIEASRKAEAYYRTLVDSIPDLIWYKDTQGVFLSCNKMFERFFGAKEEQIVGKTDYDFTDAAQADFFREHDRGALETGRASVNEEWLTFAEGGYRGLFETIKTPIRDAEGEITGVLGVARDITKRKETENALLFQRMLLEKSQELGKIGAWELHIPENILTWTDEACRIFGVPPGSVVDYEIFLAKVHPEDRDYVNREWAVAVQGNTYSVMHRLLIEGEVKWVRQKADLTFDDRGNALSAIGFIQDVTELEETNYKLKQSEERYRALYENAPIPYHSLDGNGCFLDVNPAWLSALGYEREEIIGENYVDFLHPEWQPTFVENFPKLKQSGHVHDVHFKIRHKDGHYLDISLDGCIGRNFDGSFKQTYCVFQDITRVRESEEELRQSEGRFRLLVESSPDAVFVRNRECFTYLNAAAVKLFGAVSEKDLIGTPIIERYHPQDRQKIRERMQMINDLRVPAPLTQSVCLRMDGTEVDVESSVVPIKFHGQNSALVFMRDITERVEQLKRQHLLEEQLHQSQKIESVGRLAGGVAHDYNNMLSVIIGHAEMAKRKLAPPAPVHKDLDQILQAANRSQAINQQLLAFARKQIVQPKVIDLNASVEGMLKMLHKLLGEQIEMNWNTKGELWPVRIDPIQLDQILANLCVNARDAIVGTGHLTIATDMESLDQDFCDQHPGSMPGDYVTLTVIDDGQGMNEETLEKIFEPFFTTKGVGVGTGLGLSTVYGIVKQCQGYIDVSSEPGKGTTFKIYLPRYEGPAEAAQIETVEEVHQGRGEMVFLVEDDKAVLGMTTEMLEAFGYKVLTANRPKEAIALAETYHGDIQLLVTDVVMPEMNGRELCDRLSQLYPDMKCLYISGYTEDVIAHHGVLDEGLHFLQKPFAMADFSAALRKLLG